MIIKNRNKRKRNKKLKNDYEDKMKCRIKNRLSSKVWMFNFRGYQSCWSPLDTPRCPLDSSGLPGSAAVIGFPWKRRTDYSLM